MILAGRQTHQNGFVARNAILWCVVLFIAIFRGPVHAQSVPIERGDEEALNAATQGLCHSQIAMPGESATPATTVRPAFGPTSSRCVTDYRRSSVCDPGRITAMERPAPKQCMGIGNRPTLSSGDCSTPSLMKLNYEGFFSTSEMAIFRRFIRVQLFLRSRINLRQPQQYRRLAWQARQPVRDVQQ
jgi:hypothetical protein